jgi:hypothetical protein
LTIEIDRSAISSDNFSMQLLVTLSISVALAVHAVLGCCAHHEHPVVAEYESLDTHQPCHCSGHHATDSEENSGSPPDCDEENCVFVSCQHSDFPTIDWAGLSCQSTISTLADLSDDHPGYSQFVCEDGPYLGGPPQRIWQCVWVI